MSVTTKLYRAKLRLLKNLYISKIRLIRNFYKSEVGKFYKSLTNFKKKYLFSLLLFFMRFWMAKIFWFSGIAKFNDWETALFLFEYEYKTPFLTPWWATLLATGVELVAPVLLIIGWLSRFAAGSIIVMVAVIQYTYLELTEHLYWAILLGCIILYGPGKISLDHLFEYMANKKVGKKTNDDEVVM